jgi:hypothetical protein
MRPYSRKGVAMHQGHYVFAQLMQHLPLTTFRRCVARYDGERRVKRFVPRIRAADLAREPARY